MENFTLERFGDVPVTFIGEILAEAGSRTSNGATQNRWHELTIYQTQAGNYVAHVLFRSCWQGERDRSTVFVSRTAEELRGDLVNYDPCSEWQGYPEQQHYRERNERLRQQIKDAYKAAVSQLFTRAHGFAEPIE